MIPVSDIYGIPLSSSDSVHLQIEMTFPISMVSLLSLGADESNYSQRLPKFCPGATETFVRLAEGGFGGDD